MSDVRRHADGGGGRQYYGEHRLSGYGDQGYQRRDQQQLTTYEPRQTPPPSHADYHTPMAVQYQDNGQGGGGGKSPHGAYLGPSSQAYYNPQIAAAHQADRQEITSIVITGDAPKGPPPMDYYRTSVCLTFGCFFPLGIYCWMKSKKCRAAIRRGDYELARQLSQELKIYTEVTLGLGWFSYVMIIVLLVVVLSIYLRGEQDQ